MAKVSLTGIGRAGDIARTVEEGVLNSGLSCELVDSVHRSLGNEEIYILVFEKFYYRAGNRASLTVVICGDGQRVLVDTIGSGGGQGAFLSFSWGAEESFASTVADILRPLGFQ